MQRTGGGAITSNFRAEIQGTGSQSKVTVNNC